MITQTKVTRAARDLIERHGRDALHVAREWVAELERARDLPAMDVALRVLTECERLLAR